MSFYESLRDNTAAPLLKKYGQKCIVEKKSEGSFNSVIGGATGSITTEYIGNAVTVDYNVKEIDGTNIKQGDKKILAILDDKTVEPMVGDVITLGIARYAIKNVNTLSPGDTAVMFTIQGRR